MTLAKSWSCSKISNNRADIFNPQTKQLEALTRYYHPLSKVTDVGYLDLLVKVYLRNL